MLGLLLEAVAGEMPAGAEEEPPEACPRCGCPPHRQEGPRRRRGAKEALPRVRPQLPGVDGAGARHHQAARGDLGALRRGDARGRHAARRRRRVRRLAQDQLLDAPPPLRGDGVDAAGLRGGPGLPGGGRRGARARLAFGQPLEVGGFSMPRPARRRGGDGAAAGVSSDKVSVLTMVNARGDAMAVAACRGKMGVADARRAMAGCALEGGRWSPPTASAAMCAPWPRWAWRPTRGSPPPARAPRSTASTPCTPRSRRSSPASGACPPGAFPTLPRVVLLGALGAPGRGRRLAAAGADGVGDIPDELARALAAAVPVPPGDFHVIGGLTQPQ